MSASGSIQNQQQAKTPQMELKIILPPCQNSAIKYILRGPEPSQKVLAWIPPMIMFWQGHAQFNQQSCRAAFKETAWTICRKGGFGSWL